MFGIDPRRTGALGNRTAVGGVMNLVGLVVDAIFSVLKNERPYTPMLN